MDLKEIKFKVSSLKHWEHIHICTAVITSVATQLRWSEKTGHRKHILEASCIFFAARKLCKYLTLIALNDTSF